MRLADVIQPHDVREFLDEYWEKRPLLVRGADADRFGGLFSLADVDHVFATPALIHSSSVRVIRDGRGRSFDQIGLAGARGDHPTVEALLAEHRRGATIALQAVNRIFPALQDLCQALSADLSATMQVNAYVTPPSSQGFDTHFDTHDVFILQIAGGKRWNVFEAPVALPVRLRAPGEASGAESATPLLDVELRPGDVMYIPRGFPHHAVSAQATSLHLTVGVHTITWAAVLRAVLDAQSRHDPRLRASLPPGFADDEGVRQAAIARFGELISALADTADGAAVLDDAAELVRRGQRVVLPGRFLDAEYAHQVSGDTRIRRRTGIDCAVNVQGDRIRLEFNGKAVTLPAFAENEVRHLLSVEECCADELPGDVDEEGRLVLIRSLLREGLLTVSRDR